MDPRLDFLKGHSVAVYSSQGCPDCTRLERWMRATGFPHAQVDIGAEPGAADKLEAETGKQAVPFLLVDGRTWVRGYHKEIPGRFAEQVLLDELRAALAG